MNKSLYRLAVVSCTESRTNKGKKCRYKRRRAFCYVRYVVRLILLAEKIDTHHDAVLAIREALDPVVANRAKRLSTSVALDVRDVLTVIGTIHLLFVLDVSCSGDRFLVLRRIRLFSVPGSRTLLISLLRELKALSVDIR